MPSSKFMELALKEARKAYKKNEVPVGAVLVKNNTILAKAHNLIVSKKNPSAHAELLVIQKASKKLNTERLLKTVLYTTLEPCPMCAFAIVLARVGKVVYGTSDDKTGAIGSVIDFNRLEFNHKFEVEKGILMNECQKILQDFFYQKRELKQLCKYT